MDEAARPRPDQMGPQTSTFTLLEKAGAGDREALSLAFERHRNRLTVLAHFKMSPQARRVAGVEDVVQETMLRAFRDLDRFSYRTPGSFFRWLSSILDHVIVDRARYLGRERRAGEEVPFRSESNPRGPEPKDSQTPSRILGQGERVERLLERLGALPTNIVRPFCWRKSRASPLPKLLSVWASRARRWPCWSTAP